MFKIKHFLIISILINSSVTRTAELFNIFTTSEYNGISNSVYKFVSKHKIFTGLSIATILGYFYLKAKVEQKTSEQADLYAIKKNNNKNNNYDNDENNEPDFIGPKISPTLDRLQDIYEDQEAKNQDQKAIRKKRQEKQVIQELVNQAISQDNDNIIIENSDNTRKNKRFSGINYGRYVRNLKTGKSVYKKGKGANKNKVLN